MLAHGPSAATVVSILCPERRGLARGGGGLSSPVLLSLEGNQGPADRVVAICGWREGWRGPISRQCPRSLHPALPSGNPHRCHRSLQLRPAHPCGGVPCTWRATPRVVSLEQAAEGCAADARRRGGAELRPHSRVRTSGPPGPLGLRVGGAPSSGGGWGGANINDLVLGATANRLGVGRGLGRHAPCSCCLIPRGLAEQGHRAEGVCFPHRGRRCSGSWRRTSWTWTPRWRNCRCSRRQRTRTTTCTSARGPPQTCRQALREHRGRARHARL